MLGDFCFVLARWTLPYRREEEGDTERENRVGGRVAEYENERGGEGSVAVCIYRSQKKCGWGELLKVLEMYAFKSHDPFPAKEGNGMVDGGVLKGEVRTWNLSRIFSCCDTKGLMQKLGKGG